MRYRGSISAHEVCLELDKAQTSQALRDAKRHQPAVCLRQVSSLDVAFAVKRAEVLSV